MMKKLELLFVRELYNFEDNVLPRRIGLAVEKLLCSNTESYHYDDIESNGGYQCYSGIGL